MYRSVSALILCGTIAIAAAPRLAVAKDTTCIRTSHGVVMCGQMVERGRATSPKQYYESRSAAAKHNVVVHSRSYQEARRGHAPQYAERGRTHKDAYQKRDSKHIGRAQTKTTYAVVEPAKSVRSHDVVSEDRPQEATSRERHADVVYSDRGHKPVKQTYSRSGHAVNSARSRTVVYREHDDRQAKRGHSQQDVYSDEPGQEVHQDGSRQANGRDHRDQDDQDQKD